MKSIFKMTGSIYGPNRTQALPFPGIYPTRWFIYTAGIKGKGIVYIGKPNPTIMKQVLAVSRQPNAIVYVAEFDRGGQISNTPFRNGRWLEGYETRTPLAQFYYVNNGFDLAEWATRTIHHKCVSYQGKKWVVYSRTRDTSDRGKEGYLRWLKQSGVTCR